MMSETATVRLPPGFQACLPWLARGVGPEAANCYTKRPRLQRTPERWLVPCAMFGGWLAKSAWLQTSRACRPSTSVPMLGPKVSRKMLGRDS